MFLYRAEECYYCAETVSKTNFRDEFYDRALVVQLMKDIIASEVKIEKDD